MKKLLLAGFLTLAAGVAFAQDFKTGYFLDNYVYSYRVNPGASLDGKPGTFVGVGIGNISASANSNLSVSSFLNKDMDRLFFDSAVSLEEALAGFEPQNSLLVNANVNLITFGRQTDHNRFSVELNARSDSYFYIPKDFVATAKGALEGLSTGTWGKDYVFSGLQANANLYTELAFGYTHKLSDALTIGGRFKGLVGLADVNANMDADVHIQNWKESDEIVSGKVNGTVHLASPVALDFAKNGNNYDLFGTDYEQILNSLLHDNHRKIAGWGAAIDLGVSYEPIEGLTLDASLLDLGFIRWNSTINGNFCFDESVKTGEGGSDLASRILAVEDSGLPGYASLLNYTIHAGAKYRMPFYDRLSVGLLGTIQKHYKEVRLGANVSPLDFLSIAASGALTTFGGDFGLALNLRVPGVDFFVGTDAVVFAAGPIQNFFGKKLNTLLTAGLVIAI